MRTGGEGATNRESKEVIDIRISDTNSIKKWGSCIGVGYRGEGDTIEAVKEHCLWRRLLIQGFDVPVMQIYNFFNKKHIQYNL